MASICNALANRSAACCNWPAASARMASECTANTRSSRFASASPWVASGSPGCSFSARSNAARASATWPAASAARPAWFSCSSAVRVASAARASSVSAPCLPASAAGSSTDFMSAGGARVTGIGASAGSCMRTREMMKTSARTATAAPANSHVLARMAAAPRFRHARHLHGSLSVRHRRGGFLDHARVRQACLQCADHFLHVGRPRTRDRVPAWP